MNKLKHHFLGGLVFLGTITFGYIGYTAYTSLSTQTDGAVITKDIWNNVINTINDIGNRTDGIYSSGGNIGIGTSNPQKKIEVNGNVKLDWIGNQHTHIQIGHDRNDAIISDNSIAQSYGGGYFFRVHDDTAPSNYRDVIMLTKTGSVGIGINNPISKLTVNDGPVMRAGYNRNLTLYANHPSIQFKGISNTNHSAFIRYDARSTTESIRFRIGGTNDDIGTAPEIMTLTSNGNVGIGITTPSQKLHINGTALATAWTTTSDIRLKKDIKSIDYGISTINKLNPVNYYWKDKTKDKSLQYGFIAQEIEKVLPDLVKTDDKGYKSVNYTGIIPILTKSIQEQDEKIKILEARLEKLEK